MQGLRLDKDGGSWVRTSLPEASQSRIERKADLRLVPETGSLEGKVTVTYTGLEALYRRSEERNEDITARKKFLEDELDEYIPATIEAELSKEPDWKSPEAPLVAEFTVKVPGWVASAGHRALLGVGLFSGAEKHVFEHANRVHPIYFDFPYQAVDDISISLPSGWQVSSLPPAQKQDAHICGYDLSVENKSGTLQLQRQLSVSLLLLDTKFYGALRNFYQTVRTGDEQQIVLLPGRDSAQK